MLPRLPRHQQQAEHPGLQSAGPRGPATRRRDGPRARAQALVAVNKPSLDLAQALRFIGEAQALGIDEIIVSSLALMRALRRRRGPRLSCRLSLSVTNPVFNSEALGFFRRLGVDKVCLPRHLSLDEMAPLCRHKGTWSWRHSPMSGLCMNVEAYCGLPLCPGIRRAPHAEPCHYRWRTCPRDRSIEGQLTSGNGIAACAPCGA